MSRVVLIGPPGAGKGTQAKMLERRLDAPHISSGDLLREAVRLGTPKGIEAKGYIERGQLVPDALVLSLVEERIAAGDAFLLDGFPRNLPQARTLTDMLRRTGKPIDYVVSLKVPVEDVVRRLGGRRTCRQCHAMYHMEFEPPRVPDRCDKCGGQLYQREDDREETIRARLEVFARETAPLLEYYREESTLREVDGVGNPAEVAERIVARVASNA